MTKVMTVLVAAEHIENWDETFTMTQSIIDPLFLADASMAGFVHGEEVSMTELLYGAVLPSGAEATEALAIVTAGSEEAFAALMNEKAQELARKIPILSTPAAFTTRTTTQRSPIWRSLCRLRLTIPIAGRSSHP